MAARLTLRHRQRCRLDILGRRLLLVLLSVCPSVDALRDLFLAWRCSRVHVYEFPMRFSDGTYMYIGRGLGMYLLEEESRY
jgi:hypothetical protein